MLGRAKRALSSATETYSSAVVLAAVAGAACIISAVSRRPDARRVMAGLATTAGISASVLLAETRLKHSHSRLRLETRQAYEQAEQLVRIHAILHDERLLPPMRGWALSPDVAAVLLETVLAQRPKTIVELGSGSSTVLLAQAVRQLDLNANLVSIEHDAGFAAETRKRLNALGLDGIADIRVAPLTESLRGSKWYDPCAFADLDGIDLLFVDGPPRRGDAQTRRPALERLADCLNEGATIVLDDAFRQAERQTVEHWLQTFPALTGHTLDTEKGTFLGHWASLRSEP